MFTKWLLHFKPNTYFIYGLLSIVLWLTLVQALFFSILERHANFVTAAMATQARQQTGTDQTLFAQGLAEHAHLGLISCLRVMEANGPTILDMEFLGPCEVTPFWLNGIRTIQEVQTLNGHNWTLNYTVLSPTGLNFGVWICRVLGIVTIVLLCFIQLLRDRSAMQRLSQESAKAAEVLRISRQVGHDIRSPMGALSIVMRKEIKVDSTAFKISQMALPRMESIVTDLLAQGAVSTGQQKPKVFVRQIDLTQIMHQAVAEKKVLSPAHVKWGVSLGVTTAWISITEAELARIASNLLQNCIEATLETANPVIEIEVLNLTEGSIQIAIQDNGCGMTEDVLLKVLNSEPVTFGKKNGHGLGLSSVLRIVESAGGRLDIWSKFGSGTRISILLPEERHAGR